MQISLIGFKASHVPYAGIGKLFFLCVYVCLCVCFS